MPPHASLASRPCRRSSSWSLPALLAALCLWIVGTVPAPAAPGRPAQVGPFTNAALLSNDVVGLDPGYPDGTGATNTGGAILNFSVRNNGTAAETVLASATVGSGVTYRSGKTGPALAVSPAGTIYYYDNSKHFVALDPATLVRTVVSDGADTAFGPAPASIQSLTWDFATGTVLYYDYSDGSGTGATRPYPGSGFYRLDPATGKRAAVSLNDNTVGSGVTVNLATHLTADAFGNLFYLNQVTVGSNTKLVAGLPASGAPGAGTYGTRKVVSSASVGDTSGGTYHGLLGLSVDPSQAATLSGGFPASDSLIVTDAGNDQNTSAIYRVPSSTGDHNKLISYGGATANTGSAVFDYPISAVVDASGRIYYDERHNGTYGILTVIPAGTRAAASLSGATNLSAAVQVYLAPVPPPAPTLATGTASNVSSASATLNSTVAADGGVANSGVVARGFVYAPTAINSAPKIGGMGVTQVSNFTASSLPVAQGSNLGAYTADLSGLTPGTSYTFSAYAQNVSGFAYTTPVTFATPTAPAVTTTAASGVTDTAATLGGNVTADGGAAVTARGVVYSSADNSPGVGGAGVTNAANGTGTGAFSAEISGLANGTTYYFRAYATNAVGTTYGQTFGFTTLAPPVANSQSVNVTFNTPKPLVLTGTDPNTPPQRLSYNINGPPPAHGALMGSPSSPTYTPNSGYQGADSFQFTVTNSSGLTSSPATVTLNVSAGTPTARPQTVGTPANTAKAITLTGTDPDRPALALTYAVAGQPAHGTLTGTVPGLTYTPAANFAGTDSFTFTASNGANPSAPATVTINVTGFVPSITSAASVVFTDSAANTFTVTATGAPNPALTESGALPAGVTFTDNGDGTATLGGAPAAGASGSYPLTITASNGNTPAATQSFKLTLNRPPTTGSVALGTTQNTAAQVSAARLLAAASDADGDMLSVTSAGPYSTQGGTVAPSAPDSAGEARRKYSEAQRVARWPRARRIVRGLSPTHHRLASRAATRSPTWSATGVEARRAAGCR